MPQITLKLSQNIDLADINLKEVFAGVHDLLGDVPNLDNRTCFAGVVQEDYSYIGLNDTTSTKVFLEILWLETSERVLLKPVLAERLMVLLLTYFKSPLEKNGLVCTPRIRIADLGEVGRDYFIYKSA